MKRLVTAGMCIPFILFLGCSGKAPKTDSNAEKDSALRAQLVGVWERA